MERPRVGDGIDSLIKGLGKRHCLAGLAVVLLVHALVLAPAGFINTDEFVYAAMPERLLAEGSLFFGNGYGEIPSRTLELLSLTPGRGGLTPKAPSGYAFLAAPFFALAGIRGLVLVNTLAAIGVLALTYRLARTLFDDEDMALNAALILGLTTYFADYAFAIMPHATATLFMLAAGVCAAESAKRGRGGPTRAALAGLMLGLGVNVRLDVIMLAPLLAAWLIANAPSPWRSAGALVLGLAPGLAVAAALNEATLGTLNPLAYRADWAQRSDATSLAGFGQLAPLLIAGALAAGAFAFGAVRRWMLGWRGAVTCGAGLALLVALPLTSGLVLRILEGLYVLVINLQAYDPRGTYSAQPVVIEGGWILFAGNVKKALFESLPYAGFLVLPLAGLFRGRDRGALALLFLVAAAWCAFFALRQWHGGQATNMRYFFPVLPLLAILAAAAWRDLKARAPTPPIGPGRALLLALAGAAGLVAIWLNDKPFGLFALVGGLKWLLALGLAIALAVLAFPGIARLGGVARALFGILLAAGFLAGAGQDVGISHKKRGFHVAQASDCRAIEANALVIAFLPRFYHCHFMRPGSLTAVFRTDDRFVDSHLIGHALGQGRPVYVDARVREAVRGQPELARRYRVSEAPVPGEALYRLTPARG
jgi:4-amino-4-deoxy-L-arabinose transferase-like glycosyltransferase